MYGLKVKDLMAMDKWIPHQGSPRLGQAAQAFGGRLRSGHLPLASVVRVRSPRPQGRAAQGAPGRAQRLKEGEVEVRTHPKMELSYNYKRIDGKATWSKFYEEGYIWHDFSCIPQPLAHKAKMEGKDIDGSGAGHTRAWSARTTARATTARCARSCSSSSPT